jgi:CRP/FNR family transcriptional activator FtrB
MVSTDWLKNTELFDTLNESQLNTILTHSEVKSCVGGETIFKQGDEANYLYVLIEGLVDLSVKTGEKFDFLTSKIEKEGAAFGIPSLIEPFHYNVTATCLKPSKILVINAGRVKMEIEKDPKIGLEIMKKLVSIYFNRINELRSGVSNLLKVFKFKTS